jgi:REP element-mobilizing transposase RayT
MRLPRYDYAGQGAYFVTICTRERECIFGEVVDGGMQLNDMGRIVEEEWSCSSVVRKEIEMDAFVVMPNHIHGIVLIHANPVGAHGPLPGKGSHSGRVGAHGRAPLRRPPRSLGSFVAGFKASATKRINLLRRTPGRAIWHRNYYEHVIRGEKELDQIRRYIIENPLRWELDEENPAPRPA